MNPSEALALAQRLGLHALRVSRSGEPVLTFGDQCRPVVVHSVRKSLISALFGQIVERGLVSLGTTLAELDVDDTPRLTAEERSATVRDLLQARSGVYLLPAAQPPPAPAHLVPPRRPAVPTRPAHTGATTTGTSTSWATSTSGSPIRACSSVWTARSPGHSASPTGIRTGTGGTTTVTTLSVGTPATRTTSSRCLLATSSDSAVCTCTAASGRTSSSCRRAGSTRPPGPVSRTSAEADHSHYGHLWWVSDGSGVLPSGTFSALGLGGQFLTVVPAVDLVLVGLVDSYAHPVQPLGPADRTRLYRALLT